MSDQDVRVDTRNAAAQITLTRPRALNALTDAMRAEISDALSGFARDPIIYALVIKSDCDRAFCAGGDVRELVELARTDVAAAHASFGREYLMDWRLECFPKPTVSLINGFVAGSGVGLTAFGTHRVAGEDYAFAMPETAIGLFPDVGVSHALARLPHEIGTYLALTGVTIGRGDAIKLDLATHAIRSEDFATIEAALSEARPVDAVLHELAEKDFADATPVWDHRSIIAEIFAGDDATVIIARLQALAKAGAPNSSWAAGTLAVLNSRSPLSICVTLRQLRSVKHLDIRETLVADYYLAGHFLRGDDFREGVRAMLIDKDRAPVWQHPSIADVPTDDIASYFDNNNFEIYDLPPREDMQRLGPV